MTETAYDRPRLRPEVVLGPALRSGPKTVHHVKDARTGCYYRVGPREHFIMGLMDGSHTLTDIGRKYTDTYDRRLGPAHWQQMFTLLGRYQLLDGYAEDAALDKLRQAHEAKQAARQGWLRRRWVILRPDQLCADLAARLAFAFRAAFLIPALLLVAAVQVLVWTHVATLTHEATDQRSWALTLPLSVVLLWGITVLHEFAHGVTCRHFGGTVTEIGLSWRFPMLTPYCRTDDIVLFHRRRARVGTAFAGVFVSLLALVPVMVWWWLAGDGGLGRSLAAGLLLFGSGGAAMSLLPILRSDGYVMLTHALNIVDLRRESYRFWRLRLRRRDPTVRERLSAYPPRDTRAYALYGIVALLLLGLGYCALMWVWFGSLQRWTGPVWAVVILAAESAVLVGVLLLAARGRSGEREATDA
ncbi:MULTISPECIES: M50 family metallopeptidase [unclassified Streptomyces]|uniref:M50 family metallopeptidase n=1 Tax=unclassified Streptomyces TaxID=2593676 RepID=UPI0022529A65|nr:MULTISPECIES: M50 family metallopeptidase [unclassified Streptomyces]WSP59107.1 M50 family metallopeptidase [Streptomyces sp. NBC_01241]WSU20371.1 M50 family metallopeptidase [Streptomyces sp. NBC_01108]MCX4790849.1 M50 family metallopeptidase [Streptomyces sp. NBC_01221]MCX4793421.1 M50 family metallopeptidase [Streptomyces sp. NBC_01242]WSJ34857.1 M50 family metallopeptidase [Streptomyces sp. NBC_01321]